MIVKMLIAVFWVVTPCSIVGRWLLHPQDGGDMLLLNVGNNVMPPISGSNGIPLKCWYQCTVSIYKVKSFQPEEGRDAFLQNVDNRLHDHAVSQLRRPQST
jgi:hypothetical protein